VLYCDCRDTFCGERSGGSVFSSRLGRGGGAINCDATWGGRLWDDCVGTPCNTDSGGRVLDCGCCGTLSSSDSGGSMSSRGPCGGGGGGGGINGTVDDDGDDDDDDWPCENSVEYEGPIDDGCTGGLCEDDGPARPVLEGKEDDDSDLFNTTGVKEEEEADGGLNGGRLICGGPAF